MKRTTVDRGTGDVVCPRCGARNQFVSKRTGKAKVAGAVLAGPVGVAVAPKRLKCSGCGANLKRGKAPSFAAPVSPVALGVVIAVFVVLAIIGATH